MTPTSLTIFCNHRLLDPSSNRLLEDEVHKRGHRLIWAANVTTSNLSSAGPDPALAQADVVLGQPDVESLMRSDRVQWVHLTTAGYERYDRDDLKAALRRRNAPLTTSSSVYREPCAQHVLAMMLAASRQLPAALDIQRTNQGWPAVELRRRSRVLCGQTAVILSFGSIARRVAELLRPFGMEIIAVRRKPAGDEGVRTVSEDRVDEVLPLADHLINILPGGTATRQFLDARRLALLKPGAMFYNIGRGQTVDQAALMEMLGSGRLSGAYLDVMDPEPLPAQHPLWKCPNCYLTPHTAGGWDDEFSHVVGHFIANLDRWGRGEKVVDRVI